MWEKVKLTRDCQAVQVPSGEPVVLKQGAEVSISQALGNSYTVTAENGTMLRIAAENADALGKEAKAPVALISEEGRPRPIADIVWDHLRTCYDPEIPVNIAELGLIYECKIEKVEGKYRVMIQMTLTAPGCGMGDVLSSEIRNKIKTIPDVEDVDVRLVWDPPWDRDMMSDAAKLELGLL